MLFTFWTGLDFRFVLNFVFERSLLLGLQSPVRRFMSSLGAA